MPFCTKCGSQVTGAFCAKCGAPAPAPQPGAGAPPPPQYAPPPPPAGMSPAPPPAAMAPAPPAKKKSILPWVLGGCLVIIAIGALMVFMGGWFVMNKAKQAGLDPDLIRRHPGLAAVQMMVAANPDVEIVSVDERNDRITLREKKTGKTTTLNLKDAASGRIQIDSESGRIQIEGKEGEGAQVQVTTPEGTMRMGEAKFPSWMPAYPDAKEVSGVALQGKEDAGTVIFKTSDTPEKVITFYELHLGGAGWKTSRLATSESSIILQAENEGIGRACNIVASREGEATMGRISYQAKQQ